MNLFVWLLDHLRSAIYSFFLSTWNPLLLIPDSNSATWQLTGTLGTYPVTGFEPQFAWEPLMTHLSVGLSLTGHFTSAKPALLHPRFFPLTLFGCTVGWLHITSNFEPDTS